MMNYNEWKILNESLFSLGLKSRPIIGGPIGGTGIQEGGFDFNKKDDEDDSDEDDYDDEDGEDGDDDIADDQLDGDIFGASKDEGGPKKSFPPDDSESMDSADMDGMDFDDDQFDLAGLGGEGGDKGGKGKGGKGKGGKGKGGKGIGGEVGADMDHGDDAGLDGIMGGGQDMGADDMSGLGGGMDDMMGGDAGGDLGGGLDDIMGQSMGGDDAGLDGLDGLDGGMGGDDVGGDGEPCDQCNPDGTEEEGHPDCPKCHGDGFVDDMGGGEIDGAEMGHDIDKMNFMNHMANYQKKYMNAMPGQNGVPGQNPMMNPQMQQQGQQVGQPSVPPMQQQQQQNPQMQQRMMQKKFMAPDRGHGIPPKRDPRLVSRPRPAQIPQDDRQGHDHGVDVNDMIKHGSVRPQQVFQKKFMSKGKEDPRHDLKKFCTTCENKNIGTYQETHDDFLSSLTSNAKGEARKKWSSGISEDSLLQAVDPNADYDTSFDAGQVGFAPQGRVGGIGGGYTQKDVKQIPVLGEASFKNFKNKKK